MDCQKKLRLLMEGEEVSDSEETNKMSPTASKPFPKQVNLEFLRETRGIRKNNHGNV